MSFCEIVGTLRPGRWQQSLCARKWNQISQTGGRAGRVLLDCRGRVEVRKASSRHRGDADVTVGELQANRPRWRRIPRRSLLISHHPSCTLVVKHTSTYKERHNKPRSLPPSRPPSSLLPRRGGCTAESGHAELRFSSRNYNSCRK